MSECEGCTGNGVRDDATPGCPLTVPSGWRIVERCDYCEIFTSDLAAAEAVSVESKWVSCANSDSHVIAKGRK